MKKTKEMFNNENEARKIVEFNSRKLPFVRPWEIWWYYAWINIWQEISKWKPYQRPCLIIREFDWSSLLLIIPLTTKLHRKLKESCIFLNDFASYNLKPSWLLLHQAKVIDKKRLQNKVHGKIASKWFITYLKKKLLK